MEFEPGHVIKGYEIIEIIGKGAMSRVYLVKKNNTFYALKESFSESPDFEAHELTLYAIHREAELLYGINHPGLPRFHERFKNDRKLYLVMEYIRGESLEDIIRHSERPFEEKRVLEWGIQLCDILFYLHTLSPEPVIYRDLKPSNIIITGWDTLKLIDFGVARRYDPNKDSDTERLGTPGYAAPEQCRKKGQSLPQSDIYALGVVLHQSLTLYDPSSTPFKLPAVRRLNDKVSEQLEWIINKAISLDLRDRYVDIGLFKDELLDYYKENFGSYASPYEKEVASIVKKSFSSTVYGKYILVTAIILFLYFLFINWWK